MKVFCELFFFHEQRSVQNQTERDGVWHKEGSEHNAEPNAWAHSSN